MDTNLMLIRAMADIRSRQIVLSKFSKDTQDFYPDAYVYAVANSVYPIFHEQRSLETNPDLFTASFPYYDTYRFSETTVMELHNFLVEKWSNKEPITFYEIEYHYRGTWPDNHLRIGLMWCLRYFFLEGSFDENFWKNVSSSAPVETNSIVKPFEKSDLQKY